MERSEREQGTGIARARQAVEQGDDAVVAYLLDVPVEDVRPVSGPRQQYEGRIRRYEDRDGPMKGYRGVRAHLDP